MEWITLELNKNEEPAFIEIEVMPKMVIDKKSIAKPIQIQIGKIKLEMESEPMNLSYE